MITSSSFEPVQQLNGFVQVHIQRNGIAYVVENYQPIREQYYAQRYPYINNQQWEDKSDVQCTTCKND